MLEGREQIGEAGQGAERGRGIMSKPGTKEIRQVVEGGGVRGREPICEIAPQPFDGIQLWGIRGEEEQSDIGGQAEGLGFVKGPIVEQQEMETGGIGSREVIEEELKARSIKQRQFQKEALARQRFDGAIEVETLEAISGREQRLDAPGGDAAADDGQETAATFVLRPHAPVTIAGLLRGVPLGQDLGAERVLELRDVLGLFFGCERRGALGLAWSL